MGDGILGALRDRPTTLERWPKGVFEGAQLSTRTDNYRRRVLPEAGPAGRPGLRRDGDRSRSRAAAPPTRSRPPSSPSSLWLVNLGTLTFHPWPVRRTDVESPDQLRIDLDPQPGTDFDDAARVAPHVRELLAELGLEGTPKTSGGRGIHIFVPIEPRWTFTQARRATIALGRELERRLPDRVTVKWWKEERGRKIFIDYNQMARDRTIASAYSIRPNARATVSAPLRWDEVGDVHPDDFTVRTMPARFAEVGDLYARARRRARSPAYSIQPLLDLADKDERDHGHQDLPYPPEYPKMPGEPKRVQPSKDRDRPR